MTTAEGKTEAITKAVNRYLETLSQGRPDDIAALYAEDATVEDPVASEVHIGRQAIRGFYTRVENVESKTEVLTVRALLPQAHFATVYAKPAGRPAVDSYITEVSQDTWILFPWDIEPQFVRPIAALRSGR